MEIKMGTRDDSERNMGGPHWAVVRDKNRDHGGTDKDSSLV